MVYDDLMMLKILILDDMPERHAFFERCAAEHNRVHVSTADQFFEAVEAADEPFDVIFLDHDLGDNPKVEATKSYGMYNTRTLDGSDCAYWLASSMKHKVGRVVVHSINPSGAKRMVDILNDRGVRAVWTPFYQMLTRFDSL